MGLSSKLALAGNGSVQNNKKTAGVIFRDRQLMSDPIMLKIDCGNGNSLCLSVDASLACVLGCGNDCDVRLSGPGISRKHCQLEKCSDGWLITDLASTNGTTVNGRRLLGTEPRGICSVVVNDGDVIGIGTMMISLHLPTRHGQTEIIIMSPPVEGVESNRNHSGDILPAAPPVMNAVQPALTERTPATHPVAESPEVKSPVKQRDGSLPRRFGNLILRKEISHDDWGFKYLASKEGNPREIYFLRALQLDRVQDSNEEIRLRRSIPLLRELNHRAIVKYIESGELDGYFYIAMEYCNGGSLKSLFAQGIKLNYRRALRLVDKILAGLELAHVSGIIHRNLKPASILLERTDSNSFYPKITDFSLAKKYIFSSDPKVTVNGAVSGNWYYMPREQLLDFGNVQTQADIWSLGAILYEALTNRLPRPVPEGASPINTILYSDSIPINLLLPDIPKELADFLGHCLASHPSDRFQNAMHMRAALQTVAEKMSVPLN